MNILIVGSGARENAIAQALHRSSQQPQLYCCGTSNNPSISQMTRQYWVGDITDVAKVVEMAQSWGIGLAIIGPEAPLEKGLADALWEKSIPTIGPKKALAQIETSKIFARNLMQKYKIPGLPRFKMFSQLDGMEDYIKTLGGHNYVIKANGLMSGKGVKVGGEHLASIDEALAFGKHLIAKQQTVMVEEKLIGQEFSLMCFCDGVNIVPMPIVQDHKRVFVNDKGPNTGGMGSYSNADHLLPFLTQDDVSSALAINKAAIHALSQEIKDRYVGVLYGSFIATRSGVAVIEFNARFGDPEALNVLSILESDFVDLCVALVVGNLSADKVKFANLATVCKYAVPEGYPDEPLKNAVINISAVKNKTHLFLSAVHADEGKIYAIGSRTAAYVGIAETISAAQEISEREICAVTGPLFHREDIGTDKLIQSRIDALRKLRETVQ